jgi:hypothetical protein
MIRQTQAKASWVWAPPDTPGSLRRGDTSVLPPPLNSWRKHPLRTCCWAQIKCSRTDPRIKATYTQPPETFLILESKEPSKQPDIPASPPVNPDSETSKCTPPQVHIGTIPPHRDRTTELQSPYIYHALYAHRYCCCPTDRRRAHAVPASDLVEQQYVWDMIYICTHPPRRRHTHPEPGTPTGGEDRMMAKANTDPTTKA